MHLWVVAIAALVAGFQYVAGHNAASAAADGQDRPQEQQEVWPTKSWPVSTPEQQGMDSAGLARLIETVGTYRQDSLMIVRHGKIVAEAYYAPYVAGISHDLRSVTKSVVGTLTAIQLQNGNLDSVDHPVIDLFSDKEIRNVDERKKAMTVQSLLDMTSGMEWVERFYTPDETLMRMYRSPDRTGFVLDQPMASAPGAKFNYNGGNPYLLSALINRKSGQNAFDFAKKELFEPLGIKSAKWGTVDAQGVTIGEAGLFLSPHDMARFGYLYLRNGMWEGKQIIPSSWVERAKDGKVAATNGFQYANLWWSLPDKGAYMARGRHSQLILILPKLDIVAVVTGVLRDNEFYSVSGLIDDISRAVKSDKPLPADPIAAALLTSAIQLAATEKPSAVGGTPELVKMVSGKTYQFSNILRVKNFTLNFLGSDSSWVITTYTDKTDRPTERFTGLFGLDGRYRKSPPALYGINAAKGRWINERTFAMERRILGRGEIQNWSLTFDADKVTVNFENTDGFKAELHGEMSE
ncbi:serine hydrolase [Bradyrhizobium sp. BWA-3-5]|uniref:serine hydrolase domain-containing protein n=1 Tax=Bradyrhizobium sp. BWA-3-5 TaxID=3080013 RepID=UPI00293EE292|nr:serine hydrolase [Bradyrhizobium sp. BWA-3-5]WOH68456.1 serine hydrolase [Bradyrhizobium sp. BWA-3-5]